MNSSLQRGQRRWAKALVFSILGLVGCAWVASELLAIRRSAWRADALLAAFRKNSATHTLTIEYPLDGTLFPPEAAPPIFQWCDQASGADSWLISFQFPDGRDPVREFVRSPRWRPQNKKWESIKSRSLEQAAQVTIVGFSQAAPENACSAQQITIRTSRDEVGAPLFYREVNLPFLEAVKDPTRIRWRFGPISAEPPPVVLENLPVCGNCHSFSQDGQVLGMDVDYANNKASYVITKVAEEMTLPTSDIITWSDFKKEDGILTYGFLSQVSPDGNVVVSTVKDKSVFVGKPDLAFSQLFFPIKGLLAIYDRRSRTFRSLSGADDPEYVQSNPVWSPDGKHIVFARTKAYQLRASATKNQALLSPEECAEFLKESKPFRYDLYRIAYNDGAGGIPEPLAGASHNDRSNYFPRYSPDGKWIVFCRARNYMLLQPDSELFIIPATGGEARRLECNTGRMNSWHSWSPNSRWLVFSSKANSPYTQLFLTHIDDQGRSTPPVVLSNFTAPDRAANIPEFVNLKPNAIRVIRERFLDDLSHARAAYAFERAGEVDNAIREYRKAIEINPRNGPAHQRLGALLYNVKKDFKNGPVHTLEAIKLDVNNGAAQYDLAKALFDQGKTSLAVKHLTTALRLARAAGQEELAQEITQRLEANTTIPK